MQEPTASDIGAILEETPNTTFVAIKRSNAALLAQWAVQHLFQGQAPECWIPADPDSNPANFVGSEQWYNEPLWIPLHVGMSLTLTKNLNKAGDYVNGMRVTLLEVFQNGLMVKSKTGKLIMVYPWTDPETNWTFFPVRLGYATTLHKIQGATLEHITIWLDAPNVQAAGYVALSRVRYDANWRFIGDPTVHCFTPASGF